MVVGEKCFISGLHCQKKHDIYWELHDSVEGTRRERGKGEKLSDLYRFQYQRGNLFKEKRGAEFLPG